MKQTSIIVPEKLQPGTLPFKVQSLGTFVQEQVQRSRSQHLEHYHTLVWVTHGLGTLDINNTGYTIESGTIFYLKPNEARRFHPQQDIEGFVFSSVDSLFQLDEYDFFRISHVNLAQFFSAVPATKIANHPEADMMEIATQMINVFNSEHEYKMELLKRYFKIFLIHVTRTIDGSARSMEQSTENCLVRNFLALVDNHFKEKKMIADYASQLLVDVNYLSRIVKKTTGYSAGHHIRQRIVLEAKRMCRNSAAGLKEIAYSLGFFDSAHFSRFFKSLAGATFSDFKRGVLLAPTRSGRSTLMV